LRHEGLAMRKWLDLVEGLLDALDAAAKGEPPRRCADCAYQIPGPPEAEAPVCGRLGIVLLSRTPRPCVQDEFVAKGEP
jgi:hypothetical protein